MEYKPLLATTEQSPAEVARAWPTPGRPNLAARVEQLLKHTLVGFDPVCASFGQVRECVVQILHGFDLI